MSENFPCQKQLRTFLTINMNYNDDLYICPRQEIVLQNILYVKFYLIDIIKIAKCNLNNSWINSFN